MPRKQAKGWGVSVRSCKRGITTTVFILRVGVLSARFQHARFLFADWFYWVQFLFTGLGNDCVDQALHRVGLGDRCDGVSQVFQDARSDGADRRESALG